MNIYGFGIIKNGVKFDFPFRESIKSAFPLVKSFYYNYGVCEDGTELALQELTTDVDLKIIPVNWDDSRSDGGYIFSEMTNIALDAIRKDCDPAEDKDAWAIYLQSDEVLHEAELELLRSELQKAQESGCDALSFRYLHFWQSHNKIAVNKKWYPQEIRAVKVFSDVVNAADAQSFSGQKKVYPSEVHIYHYGHVRDEKAYQEKVERQIRYHHGSDENFEKKSQKWKSKDKKTITLDFLGTHPAVMKERMERLGGIFSQKDVEQVCILDPDQLFEDRFREMIKAKEVFVAQRKKDLPPCSSEQIIVLHPRWYHQLSYPSQVPVKMYSKLAREWSPEFYLKMKLYEKGIGTY